MDINKLLSHTCDLLILKEISIVLSNDIFIKKLDIGINYTTDLILSMRKDITTNIDILIKKYESITSSADMMIKKFGLTSDVSVDVLINVKERVHGLPTFVDPMQTDINYELSDGVVTNVNPRQSDINYV